MEETKTISDQIPGILDAFRLFDGKYKKEEIDAAIELKDEITPYLIMVLEDLISNPRKYLENDELFDHIYAVMLLGQFKKLSAHKLIIDIFSLPDDVPDKIFGDIRTSNLPTILLNTCGGSVKHIKNMIFDKRADEYCRISACQALAYAVVEGYTSREDVVEFFGTLFSGDEADEVSDFWGLLAAIVVDLCPEEIIDVIKDSYENGLISPGMIRYEDFDKALEMGQDRCLSSLQTDLQRYNMDDLHKSMSWWACFQDDNRKESSLTTIQQFKNQKKAKKKKTSAKKKKRKQAKKSRKKNRR